MTTKPRCKRLLELSVAPAAALITLGLVVVSSYSVFTAQTSSPSDAWSTGTVELKNDSTAFGTPSATGSALFTATGIKPNGPSVSRCLNVTYTGSLAANVKLRAGPYSDPDGLLQYLTVAVGIGSGATDASCTSYTPSVDFGDPSGSLDAFRLRTTFASGAYLLFYPSGGTSTQQVRITVTPNATMPNSVQGKTASFEFVFEAQNT